MERQNKTSARQTVHTAATVALLDRDGLAALWSEIMGRPAPRGMSQALLHAFLAFEVQQRSDGGLTKADLDRRGCSFVSVTQAFNTSTSMGRLTLNMLLSFAQFEREVTAERIRDKIAASKRKGLWMGGTLPLGYDPPKDPLKARVLEINPTESAACLPST